MVFGKIIDLVFDAIDKKHNLQIDANGVYRYVRNKRWGGRSDKELYTLAYAYAKLDVCDKTASQSEIINTKFLK